ncbi:MAG: hypothetical protein EZS28_024503 [Streblomastix strix]|uniref:SPRY domain-containing protein n=1 Tax=Streblomastix strix TaxID=222440 RepID=A0A5J4VBQ3_9EUKA|nr:MAG: hypothetical protein EZS28_024503 [Streblomastix strix]
MDNLNEYNVDGSLLGLGQFVLLEILSKIKLPQDAQQFLAVCKKIYQLQNHPRFEKIIQSIIQIEPIFIIKESSQGNSEENKFLHSDENEPCVIALDPVISEGIVRLEIIFENNRGRLSGIGIADASCSFDVGKMPQDNENDKKTVGYWSNGTLDHFSTYAKGNQWYHQRFRISAIVDMTAVPRKVVFYVDGIEQPNSVVEIPSEIRFWLSPQETLASPLYFEIAKWAAALWNKQQARYYNLGNDSKVEERDAMEILQNKGQALLHPPLPMINRVINKIKEELTQGKLIVPVWKRQI